MNKEEIFQIIESSALSVASSFPGLASLATGWNEYKNYTQKKNIEAILQEYFTRLKDVENKVDLDYIRSENFRSLIVKTCRYGEDESREEKRKLLALFLTNSSITENATDFTKNAILESLDKLSPFDIQVLRIVKENSNPSWSEKLNYQTDKTHWTIINESEIMDHLPKCEKLDVLSTLEYLEFSGLIENISSRNLNLFSETDYKEHNLTKELNRLYEKEMKLRQDGSFQAIKELEKVEERITDYSEKIEKIKEDDFYKYRHVKFYNISALGIKLIKYISS